jgi:hypothetical protein
MKRRQQPKDLTSAERWRRVHLEGDRNKPIFLADTRPQAEGEGVRRERGGWFR